MAARNEKTFTRDELLSALKTPTEDLNSGLYAFEPDGVWLDVSRTGWDTLNLCERRDLSGVLVPHGKEHPRDHERLLVGHGIPPQPLLPFPFTAQQLIGFEEGSANELRNHVPADHGEALEWADALAQNQGPGCEAAHNAAIIVRLLIGEPLIRSEFMYAMQSCWPSVKSDVKRARARGLWAAAHTGRHGFWDVDKALEWAYQNRRIV